MNILSDKIVTIRKRRLCDGCERAFSDGSEMRRRVVAGDCIVAWYECATCQQLLSTHRAIFADSDDMLWSGCVKEQLQTGQTPEELLIKLNDNG